MRVVQGATRSVCARPRSNRRTRPGAVRRAQVGGLLWPGLAGPAAQQPGRGGAQLTLASEDGRTSPQLARLSVDIALARSDNARALELAQAASKRWPDRRALGIAYAQALQNGGRHAEAQDYLRGKIRQWGADEPSSLPDAGAESGTHRQAGAGASRHGPLLHRRSAPSPRRSRSAAGARDVFRFYEQSQIDVQIKEVKDKLAEERQLLERFKSG